MMAGMIVLYEGVPHHVRKIRGTPPGPGISRGPSTYELIPVGGGPMVDVRDPKAGDLPLAPGCEACGKPAGWTVCHWDGTHGPVTP